MEQKPKISGSRYFQIAIDIASKIADGRYKIGDKLYARSSLASQYGVSSETARRAILILTDLDIVDTTKGSGVIIKSSEKALRFVRQNTNLQSVHFLKKEILESVERQVKEMKFFNDRLNKLIDQTDRFRAINPFIPYEVDITDKTPHINKTISDLNFWHNTNATIIAIERGETILMSPGPYAELRLEDTIYFIGDENSPERVQRFLYPEKEL